MNILWQDTRFALRMLWKNPGFTVVAIFTLALGIAANTTIFSAINALLLKPFAFRDMPRIVTVFETIPALGERSGGVAPANFLDIRSQSTAFESIAARSGWSANLTENERPERITGATVTPGFFEVLGIEMKMGRSFAAEEEQPGREPIVILSDVLWRRRFNAEPNIIGHVVKINERNFTVVGIAPPEANYPRGNVEMWTPFIFDKGDTADRESHYMAVVGRLKRDASVEQATSELNGLAQRLAAQYPQTNAGRSLRAMNFLESETRGPRPYLIIMLGAVGFVLLIACANVANLLLLRAAERRHEIAIRLTLGASRFRVVRQLLTESLLLAIAGGALGLLLSVWSIDALRAGMPANFTKFVSGWSNLGIDWSVFGFTMLLSLVTGVVFGLVPALQASKTNLNEALKEGGRSSGAQSGRGRNRTRSLLVITEVALSLVLLVCAGLMMRSFVKLINVDPGFNARNALTFGVALPHAKYPKDENKVNFQKRFLERLETLPGLTNVAAINSLPLDFSNSNTGFWRDEEPRPAPGQTPLAYLQVSSLNYFKIMEIPLLEGRAFDARDTADATPVLIVSRALAQKHFKGEDPLGKRLRLGNGDKPYEIVGVVGDVRHEAFTEKVTEQELAVYQPYAQNPWREMTYIMRAKNDPASLTTAVRSELQAVDKDQPVYNVRTIEQVFSESMAPQRLSSFMFAAFALVALLLAAVGIYAVIAYSVAQRTHEIGIRMALGAQRGDIFRLVIGHGMKLILIGIGAGLVAAFGVTRAMASILYGVSATDVWTFAGISALLAGVALVACYVPAQRATKVDPMIALRHD